MSGTCIGVLIFYKWNKMAGTKKYKSAGIGKMLMEYYIAEAKKMNIKN
jgi:N-acetylglutamate synthase-like GNAT family acetyltransferase